MFLSLYLFFRLLLLSRSNPTLRECHGFCEWAKYILNCFWIHYEHINRLRCTSGNCNNTRSVTVRKTIVYLLIILCVAHLVNCFWLHFVCYITEEDAQVINSADSQELSGASTCFFYFDKCCCIDLLLFVSLLHFELCHPLSYVSCWQFSYSLWSTGTLKSV